MCNLLYINLTSFFLSEIRYITFMIQREKCGILNDKDIYISYVLIKKKNLIKNKKDTMKRKR